MDPAQLVVKQVYGKAMPHRIYLKRTPLITVEPYNPKWPERFNRLKELLAPVLNDFDCRLEHVGSTSVPGLAAKPVIDADLILNAPERLGELKARLEPLGFGSRGDLGLPGREMFTESLRLDFPHNFYVCLPGAAPLRNHLELRDYLRSHPEAARRYGELKRELAARFPDDVDAYCASKSDLIAGFLGDIGFDRAEVEQIRAANLAFAPSVTPE